MTKKVTVIPSNKNPLTSNPLAEVKKRRVAAYARVSTDSDEQYTSYEAQVNYYSKFIRDHAEWEYVDVYADEGISGTNTKKREGFNRLVDDALSGKIDLIITKSISRFARNTLDTISYTRKLKAHGVEVFFEKENLWSFDPKSEFILTICASIAQEESRSISQNVTIGKRWRMQEGHVTMSFKSFLGYEKKPDGSIGINEEQAKIVKLIYRLYLVEGKTSTGIADYLNEQGIPTPTGKPGCKWTKTTIDSILTNEKYKGDALLQKTFMVDFLEHKQKKNEGEVPSYYVENSHPLIIEKDEWEMVQAEIARRRALGAGYSGGSAFTSKIICGDCGGFYGAKVWHSNDKYRRVVYQCNRKFSVKGKTCRTPSLSETEIKEKFVKAYNEVMVDRDKMIEETKYLIELLTAADELDAELERLTSEIEELSERVSLLVKENSAAAQDQEEYRRKYDELAVEYEAKRAQFEKANAARLEKKTKAIRLQAFISTIKDARTQLFEWDADIWNVFVESATVKIKGSIVFKFKNGKEITI